MADINLGVGGANSAVGGYDIDNSLKLEHDNTEYITRTNASAGNSKTWTFSGWYKLTELFSGDGPSLFEIYGTGPLKFFSMYMYQYKLIFYDYLGGVDYGKETTQVFRDTSAWYHIVLSVDTTDATAADRMKLYINGTRVTAFNTDFGDPPQNFDTQANKSGMANRIGYSAALSGIYYGGYVSEVNFVDGQALAPTDFGEFDTDTGIWKPIETNIGSYGTNGFNLKFDNSSDLGEDASGGSSFTLNNITSADQATDTPTNNFCTLNPLVSYYGSATINEGATKIQGTSTSSFETVYSTIAVTSGKWYFEVVNLLGSTRNTNFGIVNLDTAVFDGTAYNSAGFWLGNMDVGAQLWYYKNGVSGGNEYVTFSQGDIIGLAFDADNGTLDFYLNNSNQEQFTGIPSGTFAFIVEVQGTGAPYIQANFGGYTTISIASGNTDDNGYGNFEYAPPSGYYALCSKNLSQYG